MNAHPMMAEIHNAKQRMPAILSAKIFSNGRQARQRMPWQRLDLIRPS